MKHRWLLLLALVHVAAVAWHLLYWAPRSNAAADGASGPDAIEWSAIGLFEPLKTALAESETVPEGSAERILDSLRTLAIEYPTHERVQEIFLMGLSQAIYYGHEAGHHARAERLTLEFRERAGRYPESEAVARVVAALAVDDLGRDTRRADCGQWERHLGDVRSVAERFPDSERIQRLYLDALSSLSDSRTCNLSSADRAEILTLFLTTTYDRLEEDGAQWHLGVSLEQRVYWGVHRARVDEAAVALRFLAMLSLRMPDEFATRHAAALETLLAQATDGEEDLVSQIRDEARQLAREGLEEMELLRRLVRVLTESP